MDDVDLWLVQSLMEAKTGSSGRLYVRGGDPNVFLDHVVHAVPMTQVPQARTFNVFLVDDGVPDLFTLTGFSKPVICYHTGYVGKFIKFRNYIMSDPETDAIDHGAIADLFELVGGLYLQAGNGPFGTTCLLQSIIETPSRTIDKEVYDGANGQLHTSFLQRKAIDEAAFTLLYFGFTHEIGHTYADDCLRTGTRAHSRPITDDAIAEAVAESARSAFQELPDADYFFERWKEAYLAASKDKASVLHGDNLRAEILADNIGCNILIAALNSIARFARQQANFKIIASEAIIGLFVVQLIEACKYIVKALPDEQPNPESLSRYVPISVNDAPLHARLNAAQMIQDFQIAHAVRWAYLKPTLVSLSMMHLFPDTWTLKGSTVVTTCSHAEESRRQKIAASNVDGCLSYYTREMKKLQGRLEDVVHFVGHMATGKASDHRTEQPADMTFEGQIRGNFATYISRLSGTGGDERKREILAQLTEHEGSLRRGGGRDVQWIEGMIRRLESEPNSSTN